VFDVFSVKTKYNITVNTGKKNFIFSENWSQQKKRKTEYSRNSFESTLKLKHCGIYNTENVFWKLIQDLEDSKYQKG